jgi:hypothetical protein
MAPAAAKAGAINAGKPTPWGSLSSPPTRSPCPSSSIG